MPSTPAVLALRAAGVVFTPHFYDYEVRGGTTVSARELGVAEHAVIKTLVMQDEAARPCIVLMHGDCEVSTKALARIVGVKRIEPCKPEVAERHTGLPRGAKCRSTSKKPRSTFPAFTSMAAAAVSWSAFRHRPWSACCSPNW